MLSGFRKKPEGSDYIFVDGVAVRAEDVVRIQVEKPADEPNDAKTPAAPVAGPELMEDDRRKTRARVAVFGIVLVLLFLASLCLSKDYYGRFHDPLSILQCLVQLPYLTLLSIIDTGKYTLAHADVLAALPMYDDFVARLIANVKYVIAGIMLAVSGMLYQSAFRNPIAAPSMLGVSNGISLALVVLVLQFGTTALNMIGLYYLYSFIGGALILAIVLLGGYLSSNGREFNCVTMLLIGTVVSQLLGVVISYLQTSAMGETAWETYYLLQTAVGLTSIWSLITLVAGFVLSMIPIFLLRFRLNLISFSDGETRLLGVNPILLRYLALGCGSLMILVAQVNVGAVAMASLVIPFVSRAIFGSEFRKQLVGNVLLGAILILFCGDFISLVIINGVPLDLGTVVTVVALPLFVWMLMIRQRNWGE